MMLRVVIYSTTCALAACAACLPVDAFGEETADVVVVDFESAEIGKHVESWQEQGVTFALAQQPKKSKAKGRVMFFPHIASGHKGILNAMADESIPMSATFRSIVNRVELKLWGSTTSAALVEAFDAGGKLIDRTSIDQVPVRKRPEEPVPFFEMTVQGEGIASIQISGSQPGGFVAVDELRFFPQPSGSELSRSDDSEPAP